MSTFRKILLGILFIAVVIGIGYAIYFVFFKPATTPVAPAVNANVNKPGGALTPAGGNANLPYVPPLTGTGALNTASPVARGGATVSSTLVSSPTLGQMLSADGKTLRYYDENTGKFMTVDANGNIVELSDQVFPDVQSVTWSSDANKVIMEFPDGSKLSYDFSTKQQATLQADWNEFSFSPGSDQIAALQESDSESSRYLVVSQTDGSGVQAIEPLGDNADKVSVAWSPAGNVIALSATGDPGDEFGQKTVLFIGKNGENFPGTEVDGLNFTPLWSPTGAYLLYSVAGSDDDFSPRLYTVTGSGDNMGSGRRAINLFTTADKCTFFDAVTAYCAVPDSMPEGAGLSPELLNDIPDSVYKVNVTTGAVQLIGRPDTDQPISALTVSKDGSTLFFTDGYNGNIKKMALK
jgi:WD40 repeat protein